MIKKKEFTQWWFHRFSMSIRNRQLKLNKHQNNISEKKVTKQKYTWNYCCFRNQSKIRKFYKKILYGDSRLESWTASISWQKKKITRLNDVIDLWRKTENKCLNRMNQNNFTYNNSPNIIWNNKVYKQCMKVKKLYLKKYNKQVPELYQWKHVTKRARYRLTRKYKETVETPDSEWTLCIKANKLKINTIHIRSDWSQCISSNYEKMTYRYYEHSKKKKGGYKHLEFLK